MHLRTFTGYFNSLNKSKGCRHKPTAFDQFAVMN